MNNWDNPMNSNHMRNNGRENHKDTEPPEDGMDGSRASNSAEAGTSPGAHLRALLAVTTPRASDNFREQLKEQLLRKFEDRSIEVSTQPQPQPSAQVYSRSQVQDGPSEIVPANMESESSSYSLSASSATANAGAGEGSPAPGVTRPSAPAISSAHTAIRRNLLLARALGSAASRFGSAVVMLLLVAAFAAGAIALVRSHPDNGGGPKPPVALTTVETPTAPGATSAASLESVRALRPLITITTPLQGNQSLTWSPDGTMLASASDDGVTRALSLWNSSTGQKVREIDVSADGSLDGIAWSPLGTPGASSVIAVVSRHLNKGTLELWDPSTGTKKHDISPSTSFMERSMAWSPDGRYLASTDGWEIALWDSHGGSFVPKPQPTWPAPITTAGADPGPNVVTGLAWSPDGKQLATSQDRVIKIWDPLGGQQLAALDNPGGVGTMAWSPSGSIIAAIVGDQPSGGALVLWDTKSVRQIREPMPVGFGGSLAWSPQADVLAFGSWAGAGNQYTNEFVTLYDADAGKVLLTIDRLANELAWSPDGRYLAMGDALDGVIMIWGANNLLAAAQTPGAGSSHPTATPVGLACASAWKLSTLPGGLDKKGAIRALAAVSAQDIWAAASTYDANGLTIPLFIHWDGSAWNSVPDPQAGDVGFQKVNGITAVSGDDVWAVGSYSNESGGTLPLIEHWDGKSWNLVAGPDLGKQGSQGSQGSLSAVSAAATDDVWAVGSYENDKVDQPPTQLLTLHWDGRSWSVVPAATAGRIPTLDAVAAISANDVWAVGSYYGDMIGQAPGLPLTEHWDGTQWRVVATPSLGSAPLSGVASVSADDVWAVGFQYMQDGSSQMLVLHWDGVRWAVVNVPTVSGNDMLSAVAVAGKDDAWAVGSQVLRWDGNSWNLVVSPNTLDPAWERTYGTLNGLAPSGDGALWVAGAGTNAPIAFLARVDSTACISANPSGLKPGSRVITGTPTVSMPTIQPSPPISTGAQTPIRSKGATAVPTASEGGVQDNTGLSAISFIDVNHGWLADGSAILATTDGGQHWTKRSDAPGEVLALDFVSESIGWLTAGGRLYDTQDGGSSWQLLFSPNKVKLYQVDFVDAGNGWLTSVSDGDNGTHSILRTSDGGKNWTTVADPCSQLFGPGRFSFYGSDTSFIMCGEGPSAGIEGKRLLKTTDGGQTWQVAAETSFDDATPVAGVSKLDFVGYFVDVFFLDSSHGWYSTNYDVNSRMVATTDGGKTWQGTIINNSQAIPYDMRFLTPKLGFLIYDTHGADHGVLLGTQDGGASWTQLYPAKPAP
jgi:WD40 repeat protein/photosystem II stability/assembly factor-like uncharacterized protein